MSLTKTIFNNLIYNEDYARKVLPFLKREYFTAPSEQVLFDMVTEHLDTYNLVPSPEILSIELDNRTGLTQDQFKAIKEIISSLTVEPINQKWLVDETERFCQDRAVYLAIMDSIKILDGKSEMDKGAIPKVLQDALAVSFDTSIGHDYLADADARFEFYTRVEDKIPFDLEYMNKITRGGVSRKTLNIILAGTGVGKSLWMCHMASHYFMMGKNVLYITLEMSEEKISERIDANLLNVPISDMQHIPKDDFEKRILRIKSKAVGKLIVKEYPTGSANASHFRHLINELRIKKNFVPDVIFIDYLNICASSRLRPGSNVNSYTYVKAIAEELRGLGVEFGVPIWSATQTTRSGYSSSDLDLTDTSESFGLPATADLMIGISTSEELEALGQVMVKQLKNRYSDPSMHRRFVVGIDKSKMRLFNCDQNAQDNVVDDKPAFDKTNTGERLDIETKQKFKDFIF